MSLLTISFQTIFLIIDLIRAGISPLINTGFVADTHTAAHASSPFAILASASAAYSASAPMFHRAVAAHSASSPLLDDRSDTSAGTAPANTHAAAHAASPHVILYSAPTACSASRPLLDDNSNTIFVM